MPACTTHSHMWEWVQWCMRILRIKHHLKYTCEYMYSSVHLSVHTWKYADLSSWCPLLCLNSANVPPRGTFIRLNWSQTNDELSDVNLDLYSGVRGAEGEWVKPLKCVTLSASASKFAVLTLCSGFSLCVCDFHRILCTQLAEGSKHGLFGFRFSTQRQQRNYLVFCLRQKRQNFCCFCCSCKVRRGGWFGI